MAAEAAKVAQTQVQATLRLLLGLLLFGLLLFGDVFRGRRVLRSGERQEAEDQESLDRKFGSLFKESLCCCWDCSSVIRVG